MLDRNLYKTIKKMDRATLENTIPSIKKAWKKVWACDWHGCVARRTLERHRWQTPWRNNGCN